MRVILSRVEDESEMNNYDERDFVWRVCVGVRN